MVIIRGFFEIETRDTLQAHERIVSNGTCPGVWRSERLLLASCTQNYFVWVRIIDEGQYSSVPEMHMFWTQDTIHHISPCIFIPTV